MDEWFAVEARDRIIPRLVAEGRLRSADRLTRLVALDALHYTVDRLDWARLTRYVRSVTGGLGDREDEPFDPFRLGLAGSVIAWPEAVPEDGRVLEIGTGVGRTRYAVRVTRRTSLYISIDIDPVIHAIALYRNPIPAYQEVLWTRDFIVLLGDAARLVERLPAGIFDHVIHDGGPNPRRNPRLYSIHFLSMLAERLKPGGTISVFAGAERNWVTRIYSTLKRLGFRIVETVHLPGSRARVIHARLESRARLQMHHARDESLGG